MWQFYVLRDISLMNYFMFCYSLVCFILLSDRLLLKDLSIVFEVSLADLQKDEDQAHRKIRLRAEDVQGKNVLTNF